MAAKRGPVMVVRGTVAEILGNVVPLRELTCRDCRATRPLSELLAVWTRWEGEINLCATCLNERAEAMG